MTRPARLGLEIAAYLFAAIIFFWIRLPFVPVWWPDFNSDFALVGVLAQRTLEGNFPIFYYGQNYMGTAEWASAALMARLREEAWISVTTLRINSLCWWALAGSAWVFFLRAFSRRVSVAFALAFALGNFVLYRVSLLQELAAEAIFFSAVLATYLHRAPNLRRWAGFWFGVLLGLAWWTNQTVVFMLLPALWVWHVRPQRWWEDPAIANLLRLKPGLRYFYAFAAALIAFGILVGVLGGINIPLGRAHLKIPNGVTLARDVFVVVFLIQSLVVFAMPSRVQARQHLLRVLHLALPFFVGAAIGYAPVWAGRIFRLYEPYPGVGLAVLPAWRWPSQLRELFEHLDMLLLSSVGSQLLGPMAPLAVLAVGMMVAAAARACWRSALARVAVGTIILNMLYTFFSYRSLSAPVRYLYLTYACFWVLLFLYLLEYSKRRAGAVAAIALLCVLSWRATLDVAQYKAYGDEWSWRRDNIQETLTALENKGVTTCWGDMWTTYLLTYLSREKFIMSPHADPYANQVRVSYYARRVEAENPACFVYSSTEGGRDYLRVSSKNPWRPPQ